MAPTAAFWKVLGQRDSGDLTQLRDAWRKGHRCIIPAEAIYEPDWRSGKAIATRIGRRDGQPMGLAGLWSAWSDQRNSCGNTRLNAWWPGLDCPLLSVTGTEWGESHMAPQ